MRVPLEDIVVPRPAPAGLNVLRLMWMTHVMYATNEDFEPIEIQAEGSLYRFVDGRHRHVYRLVDGRHRYVAALIAGRSDILADIRR